MERRLQFEIRQTVMEAVREALMPLNEKWVSGEELCKQFSMFTPKWLREYGDILPRKRVTVTGMDGKKRSTRWAYPRNEIATNISLGLYDDLKVMH